LETGLKQGRSAEHTILSLSSSQDPMLGVRFHWLATHIQHGDRFIEALEKVPHYLPNAVVAMLRAGEVAGDYLKIIPACIPMLRDGFSQMRAAISYHILLAFSFAPIMLIALLMAQRGQETLAEITSALNRSSPISLWIWEISGIFLMILYVVIIGILFCQTLFYWGGQRFSRWYHNKNSKMLEEMNEKFLPWRRLRLSRDFTAVLACLLDAQVSEEEAVSVASDCVDNYWIRQKADRAIAALKQGVKLPEVLKEFDSSGELHWRMVNACHSTIGFRQALAGWHETLSAQAFQIEQSTSHRITTLLLFMGGTIVLTTGMLTFHSLAKIALLFLER